MKSIIKYLKIISNIIFNNFKQKLYNVVIKKKLENF